MAKRTLTEAGKDEKEKIIQHVIDDFNNNDYFMETKPTKGPWYRARNSNDTQGLVISEATGANVAVSYAPEDAALIAAAPELRDAVLHVLIASEDGGNFNDVDFRMLRDAVRKAGG
jgi:hypothetical protein